MPTFQGLPLAILTAVSTLSGEDYAYVEEPDLRMELYRMGVSNPTTPVMDRVMFVLRTEGDFLTFERDPHEGFQVIELRQAGRQEVEGWPVPGQLSRDDFDALLTALERLANDPEVDQDDRDLAQKMLDAGRNVSVDLAVAVMGAWLSARMGIS